MSVNGNINRELKSKKIDQDIFTSQLSQFICSFALERSDYLEVFAVQSVLSSSLETEKLFQT